MFLTDEPTKKHNHNHRMGQYPMYNSVTCTGANCPACHAIVLLENDAIKRSLDSLGRNASVREWVDDFCEENPCMDLDFEDDDDENWKS